MRFSIRIGDVEGFRASAPKKGAGIYLANAGHVEVQQYSLQ